MSLSLLCEILCVNFEASEFIERPCLNKIKYGINIMNRIYRVVWCHVRNTYVVASELASRKKITGKASSLYFVAEHAEMPVTL